MYTHMRPLSSFRLVMRLRAVLAPRRHAITASSGTFSVPSPPASQPITPAPSSSSVDGSEISKFVDVSAHWWNPCGPFAPLHALNAPRVRFLRDTAVAHFGGSALEHHRFSRSSPSAPLASLSILDVGCGGGILSESLAQLGGNVLGIDAAAASIAVAQRHAARDPSLRIRLSYEATTAEDLVAVGRQFDIVVASEVVEHVTNPPEFIRNCARLVAPQGMLVVSTINRTPAALALAVVFAEQIARIVPRGTHDHSRFVKPEELTHAIQAESALRVVASRGISYSPIGNTWALSSNLSVNYILAATHAMDAPVSA
eukprot:Opistho-2@89298